MPLHKKTFSELTPDELYDLLRVRSQVFVVEQDCVYQDLDMDDKKAIHVWLTEDDKILALARICPAGTHMDNISIGRVISTERGKGYGKQIMVYAIETAAEDLHADIIDIEAQEYAKGFYEKVAFCQSSGRFILDGIPHVRMTWTHPDVMMTERILLRRWHENDAPSLFRYASDPDVGPRAGWQAHQSIEESREIIRSVFANDTTWAVILRETNEPVGCMGYFTHATSNIPIGENDCEVGYWIGKPHWNKGICTEALRLMIDYCNNVKHFDNIWSDYFTGNPASGRVMEKCGFHDTGRLNRCSHLLGGDKEMVRVMRWTASDKDK